MSELVSERICLSGEELIYVSVRKLTNKPTPSVTITKATFLDRLTNDRLSQNTTHATIISLKYLPQILTH